jgi:hypothetical protein
LELDSQVKISKINLKDPSHDLNLTENSIKHSEASSNLKQELSKLKEESKKLLSQKDQQDRKLSEF